MSDPNYNPSRQAWSCVRVPTRSKKGCEVTVTDASVLAYLRVYFLPSRARRVALVHAQ